MLTAVLAYMEEHGSPGRGRVRIVAEQALGGRDAEDVRGYMRYEAASNVAYERFDATCCAPTTPAACPTPSSRTPFARSGGVRGRRATGQRALVDPATFVRERVAAQPVPAGVPPIALVEPDDVAAARALVRARAEAAAVPPEAINDLELAVSEVATNALPHGGPAPRVVLHPGRRARVPGARRRTRPGRPARRVPATGPERAAWAAGCGWPTSCATSWRSPAAGPAPTCIGPAGRRSRIGFAAWAPTASTCCRGSSTSLAT